MKAIRELPYNFLVTINPVGLLSLPVLGDKILCAQTSRVCWPAPKRARHRFVSKTVPFGVFFEQAGCAKLKGVGLMTSFLTRNRSMVRIHSGLLFIP